MENNIKIFENPDFGKVRVVDIKGEPWFAGKDVAAVLGYTDTFGAIKKHVDDDDKQNCQNSSFESPRGLTFISESGLYSLILSSKLPKAKEFKRWVTSEVLPSIRKTGGYTLPAMSEIELIAAVAKAAAEQERRLQLVEGKLEAAVDEIHINDAQKYRLRSLVEEMARFFAKREGKSYRQVISTLWRHVNSTCEVTTYHCIRSIDFERAMNAAREWTPA